MKRFKSLCLTLGLLAMAAPAVAGIFCYQVKYCYGLGGCGSGSIDGCVIECTGGGTTTCDSNEPA